MQTPLISVIIPVYKVEKYLEKCLDSVINQTYKNLEIIVVDDGSLDKCPEICDRFSHKDSRIKVIHQSNKGLSEARNAGLDIFKGEYVAFVDSDDYVEKDYIEYLYNLLLENKSEISCCQYTKIDESYNIIYKKKSDKKIICGAENCLISLISDKIITNTAWGKLFKRYFFNNIRFKGKAYEDIQTTYKILVRCKSLINGDKAKYYYLLRQSSISQSIDINQLDRIYAYIEQKNYFEKHFPLLNFYSKRNIITISNNILQKIIHSKCNLHNFLYSNYNNMIVKDFLKNTYRENMIAFLKEYNSSFKSKLFSVMCGISIPITVKLYRLKNNLKLKSSLFFLKH